MTRVCKLGALCTLWILTLLYLLQHTDAKLMGKYFTRVEYISDYTDIPRDKIDWRLYIKKLDKRKQTLAGHMFVKCDLGGALALDISLEKWGDGGYKKFKVNSMDTKNVCTHSIYSKVLENYNGTAMTPSCEFHKEKKYLTPFDIDAEMHKHTQNLVFGKFRVGMRFHVGGHPVMGFQIVLVYEDAEPNVKSFGIF